jgi:hypothetical protein
VIGTPAYFEARGVPQTPADLLAHQAIVYEQRDGGPIIVLRARRGGTGSKWVTFRGGVRRAIPFFLVRSGGCAGSALYEGIASVVI